MGFVSCGEFDEASAEQEIHAQNSYERSWLIISNSISDDRLACRLYWQGQTGISMYSVYSKGIESDSWSCVQAIRIFRQPGGDGLNWIVTASYRPYDPRKIEDPFQRPARVQNNREVQQIPCLYDGFGNIIQNSAGRPYDPPIERPVSIQSWTIEQNEIYLPDKMMSDVVNSNSFVLSFRNQTWNCAPRTLYLYCTWRDDYEAPYGVFFSVTYNLQYNPQKWDSVVPDAGYEERRDDGSLNPYYKGEYVSSPRYLDGTGKWLAVGQPPVPQRYRVIPEVPFRMNLRLPR